jgi:hypothetical protein
VHFSLTATTYDASTLRSLGQFPLPRPFTKYGFQLYLVGKNLGLHFHADRSNGHRRSFPFHSFKNGNLFLPTPISDSQTFIRIPKVILIGLSSKKAEVVVVLP